MVRQNSLVMSSNPASVNSDSPSRHVTVVDVYDLASAIGKDFEHLIEQFGTESVTVLMPKVISSLEMLEAFANRNERENEEVIALSKTVDRLEVEKKETKELRKKFEKELEQIEDNYKLEIKELWDVVQSLQEENKKLSCTLEDKDLSPSTTLSEADLKVMLKLKDTVEIQRDQLRAIERENEERVVEISTLQESIDKINRNNAELLRKNRAVQSQGRILVEEKAELIAQIQAKERWVDDLKDKLTDAERAKRDLEQSKAEETADQDRDNIPRFTLAELREVLQEKNTLKAKVMELEEELEQMRPQLAASLGNDEREEELPVQGPMPREPEEKLFPWRSRRDSGVRKLFSKVVEFSMSGVGPARPYMAGSHPHGRPADLSPTFELARSAACSSCESSVSSSEIAEAGLPSPHQEQPGAQFPGLSMDDCRPGNNWSQLVERGVSAARPPNVCGTNPPQDMELLSNYKTSNINTSFCDNLQDQPTSDYESLAAAEPFNARLAGNCDHYHHNTTIDNSNCGYNGNNSSNHNCSSNNPMSYNYDSGGETMSEVSSVCHGDCPSTPRYNTGSTTFTVTNNPHPPHLANVSGAPALGTRREGEFHMAGLGQSLGVQEHHVAFPLHEEPARFERRPSLIRSTMSKFFNAVSVALEPPKADGPGPGGSMPEDDESGCEMTSPRTGGSVVGGQHYDF